MPIFSKKRRVARRNRRRERARRRRQNRDERYNEPEPATGSGIDVDALRKEVRAAIITEKGNASPIAVRLAWHSSGTYTKATGKYGNNGAAMRFEPEISDEANAGLHIMRNILRPVINNHPEISVGDIWTFAGKCAIEFTGGPTIPHYFGRVDAKDGSGCPAHGLLPNASLGAQHLRDVFYRMGFNDREIVALSGAHTLGKCNVDRSGFDGPWTANYHTFDNGYFTTLLGNRWVKRDWDGNFQYTDVATKKLCMLPSDMALITDPVFRKVVGEYAADESVFFKDFAVAFGQLLANGVPKPRSKL